MGLTVPWRLVSSCGATRERREWLERLPGAVERLEARWCLTLGEPFEDASCAWVAPARRRDGSSAVLKIGMPHMEGEQEAQGLRFWNGKLTVRLLDADGDLAAMLLERCEPGTPLHTLPESEQDVVIAGLLRRLWRAPTAPHPFRPLSAMTTYWANTTLVDRELWSDAGLVRAGLKLFDELARATPEDVLLATDLHAGNILRSQREPWLVIDPKPFVGDRAYDATQHLFNCRDRLRSDADGTIGRIALTVNGTLNVAGDLNSASGTIISLNGVINANTFESGGLQAGVSPPPGAAVHVAGAFTQNGGVTFLPNVNDFSASQLIVNGGTFFANGFSTNTLDILSGAVFVQVGSIGAPIPAGTNFNGNPQLNIAAGGTLIDNGSVQVGGVVQTFPAHTIPGSVNTAGTVTIGSTGSLSITGPYTQTEGTTTVDGTLAASNVNINGGVLKGAGTIQGSPAGGVANVALSGATIQPSDPLSISGNFSMDNQSTFLEDIFSGSNFGALDVSGTADIAGTFDIALQNGFVPVNGERFILLDAMGGLSGTFSAIEGLNFGPGNQDSWTISYANNEVTLTAQVVPAPEPAPLALAGVAFVSLGLLRRYSKRKK